MPWLRLEDTEGRWLTDEKPNAPTWRPGDRIWRGRDSLEVVEVRAAVDRVTLVVKPGGPEGPRVDSV